MPTERTPSPTAGRCSRCLEPCIALWGAGAPIGSSELISARQDAVSAVAAIWARRIGYVIERRGRHPVLACVDCIGAARDAAGIPHAPADPFYPVDDRW